MKKVLSLLIVLLFATSAFALDNPWDKKLPFKSAIIDYKVSGTMNGEKTIYVKDYGRTTAEYSTTSMKMFGMTQQQKEIIITTPDWVHTIDLAENTGTRQVNPKKFMIQEFNNLSKSKQKKVLKNVETLGVPNMEGTNENLQKNAATILGYECDKVSMTGTIAFVVSGTDLPLEIKGDTMGVKFDQVATSIKEKSAPTSKFELPANIHFEHNEQADQMMQAQAKTMMEYLLEGRRMESSGASGQMGAGTNDSNDANQMTPEMLEQMKQMMKTFGKQTD
ncbi:MAG: hypothetical protein KOO64_01570 [Desulfobacterales bacterium]|nr:hypothetical protein [Desulfobacterales bacterium]